MFYTLKQRLLLGVYIFLILSIPVGSYLVSKQQIFKSKAQDQKSLQSVVKTTPKPKTSGAKELLSVSESNLEKLQSDSPPESDSSSPTVATSFGPTLNLQANLEGRPTNNQATKLFVGILEGLLSSNPKFLLTFSVDLPASGTYSNLSLAGLSPGTNYTALLKGSAQIATSSGFILSPAVTNLNDGKPLNLLTGDLNDDNVIDSNDYSIIQKAFGSNSLSSNWNFAADFNLDGIVNTFDLKIVSKNLGQVGASGTWTSPIPKTGTPSAGLREPSQGQGGYWIWVPGL